MVLFVSQVSYLLWTIWIDHFADHEGVRAVNQLSRLQPGSLDFRRTNNFRADQLALFLSFMQRGPSGAI